MNLEWLLKYNPVMLALFAGIFTWSITALGAAMVFFFKEIKPKILNLMLGFAAGIMIAASFWSLLEPAIEMS
jgi:ZIP family zinc transporter